MRYITLFFSSFLSITGLYALNPTEERVPGGVALIELPIVSNQPPVVFFQEHQVLVTKKSPNKWQAVVGIPLELTPGQYNITYAGTQSLAFNVNNKAYSLQHIRFTKKPKKYSHAKPNPKVLARLEREKALLKLHFSSFFNKPIESLALNKPIIGRNSGSFGLRRVYDGIPGGFHRGLDLASMQGTPIKSAKAGKVILVGDFLLTGKTILIDHGQGFITSYCHLHQAKVKPEQTVTENTIIGTVGKTGRATGPHLHFGVNLNGTRVNPELFF